MLDKKWVAAIVSGFLLLAAGSYVTHVESRFEYYDTSRIALFEDVASLKALYPGAETRLASIETQLRELNGNVAALTAIARERQRQEEIR